MGVQRGEEDVFSEEADEAGKVVMFFLPHQGLLSREYGTCKTV